MNINQKPESQAGTGCSVEQAQSESTKHVDDRENDSVEESWIEPDPNLMQSIPEERRIKAFIQGEIQLADLYGLSHAELYDIAAYGQLLYEQGKVSDAETLFVALTALDPYDENFHAALGAVYQKQGRHEEAIREYDRALQCNEGHLAALVNRAELDIIMGQFDKAVAALERAINLDPEGTDPHTQRARGLAFAVASILQEAAQQKNA